MNYFLLTVLHWCLVYNREVLGQVEFYWSFGDYDCLQEVVTSIYNTYQQFNCSEGQLTCTVDLEHELNGTTWNIVKAQRLGFHDYPTECRYGIVYSPVRN